MNWYVLYTASRAEKQVEQRLSADGVEVFLPLHLAPRRWSDRIKMVEVPLFSSYLFVKTTDEVLRSLVRITGVSRIVFYNGSPAIVREKEIEAIKVFLDKVKGKECEFLVDEEVQIASGPLKDVKGKVKKIKGDSLTLYLEQIGLFVRIKTDWVIRA